MNNDYFAFLSLYLSSLIIRNGYELLKKASRVNPKSKIIFAVVFAAMCLLWISWFSLCPLDPFRFALPGIVRWVGLAVLIMGFGLAIGGVVQLRGLENINHLVTTELFSKLRHPIYTGFILWILGWSLYHGAVVSFFIGCVGIGSILYWRRLEERNLEAWYGEDYRGYRQGTWF
jgi:protein-S-isoprenylcysteine O-methyltransferase Ste14